MFTFLGKTLLAKAVANQTSATFLRVVGSELIQKYLVNHMTLLACLLYQIIGKMIWHFIEGLITMFI